MKRVTDKERPFHEALREMRLHLGLSLEELGSLCGLRKSHLSLFENGKTDLSPEATERVKQALVAKWLQFRREEKGKIARWKKAFSPRMPELSAHLERVTIGQAPTRRGRAVSANLP